MDTSRSLRTRAVMALLLMVGFYGLALGIAGGLLWVPYAEYTYTDRIHGRIWLFCLVGAGTVLWAIMPRIDKFEAPGPRLTPTTAPQLFAIIHECAKATSQPRPEDVYILGDVNAFVSQRGGLMGFGSKRVMGVGLPLIKGLTPAELRSVIAHEFGHYVAGDVALGPWIYKTRAAIGRTLEGVLDNWILTKVFDWYGRMFMRMTMQVSREQEFVADATAARVAGVAPAISALKRTEVLAPAFSSYMDNEVMPVIRAGYLPPVTDGFDRYLSDPDVSKAFHSYADHATQNREAGEFDTHPPTAERIAALQRIKLKPKESAGDATAIMLKEPDRHVRALLEHNWGKDNVVKLKQIAWDDVGVKVYGDMWRAMTEEHAKWLGPLTADQIPADKKWFLTRGAQLFSGEGAADVDADNKIGAAIHVLTCAVGAALLRAGWTIETAPGRPLIVVHGDRRIELRALIGQLAFDKTTTAAWQEQCKSLGLTGVRLAP